MPTAEKITAVQEPPVQEPKPVKLPDRDFYAVGELAGVLTVDPMKILGWIHRGELSAINIAENPNGRPRWRIPAAAWEQFQAARSNVATAPAARAPRRRRRADDRVIKFY